MEHKEEKDFDGEVGGGLALTESGANVSTPPLPPHFGPPNSPQPDWDISSWCSLSPLKSSPPLFSGPPFFLAFSLVFKIGVEGS